jgi:transcriptional regulator with XRE-family HTH domain
MRLKRWRMGQDLNIANAAEKLGVSTATWGHWETGEHLPSGDLLLAIEDLTHIPLHVLFCPHFDDCPYAIDGHFPSPGQPCCRCGAVPSVAPAAS